MLVRFKVLKALLADAQRKYQNDPETQALLKLAEMNLETSDFIREILEKMNDLYQSHNALKKDVDELADILAHMLKKWMKKVSDPTMKK